MSTWAHIKAWKYYTGVLKIEFENDDTGYPRLVRGNDVVATYDNFKNRPKDGYYVLPFYYKEYIGSVNAQIVTRISGKTVKCTEFFIFEGFITPYNDTINKPQIYNNSLSFTRKTEDTNIVQVQNTVIRLTNGYRLLGRVQVNDDTEFKNDGIIVANIGNVSITSSQRLIGNVVSSYNKPGICMLESNGDFRLINLNGGKYQYYDFIILVEDVVYS